MYFGVSHCSQLCKCASAIVRIFQLGHSSILENYTPAQKVRTEIHRSV